MIKRLCVLGGWILCFILAANLQAACPSTTLIDSILKTNVDKDGYIDYDAIRVNKGGDLYEFISISETVDLKDCSEADRLAFWTNVYNAHMIRLVLARPTLKQVSEDFKLFGEKFKVAKQNFTLNEIEHRVIRSSAKKGGAIEGVSLKEFDPRIHFALVCGAIDCPKLYNRAYTGPTMESVLQANAVAFANNPKHVRIENGKLIMSSLLHWYEEDFVKLGGVPAYISSLIDPKLRPDAAEIMAKIKTDFPKNTTFKYDWTLNSIKNKK